MGLRSLHPAQPTTCARLRRLRRAKAARATAARASRRRLVKGRGCEGGGGREDRGVEAASRDDAEHLWRQDAACCSRAYVEVLVIVLLLLYLLLVVLVHWLSCTRVACNLYACSK